MVESLAGPAGPAVQTIQSTEKSQVIGCQQGSAGSAPHQATRLLAVASRAT